MNLNKQNYDAHEFRPCVALEVSLEVGAPAVDEEAAHRAALVAAPVVVHVLKEGQKCIYDVHCIFGIFYPFPP